MEAPPPPLAVSLVRACRPAHWVKNLLVFVPLLASHRVVEAGTTARVAVAFVAFCLAASAGYLVNDLLDRHADRRHPVKRERPFASGRAPLWAGLVFPPVLVAGAFALSTLLDAPFALALLAYLVLAAAYSLGVKRVPLADVIVLAALYVVRVVGGGTAVSIPLSFWLLAFAMFLFLSLAMVKRHAELERLAAVGAEAVPGRGYRVVDRETLLVLGLVCGGLAVLVLALYVQSEQIRLLYRRPEVVWLLCPLLLYWIGRVWMLARRGVLEDDPLLFALRDGASWWVALLAGVVVWLAV